MDCQNKNVCKTGGARIVAAILTIVGNILLLILTLTTPVGVILAALASGSAI